MANESSKPTRLHAHCVDCAYRDSDVDEGQGKCHDYAAFANILWSALQYERHYGSIGDRVSHERSISLKFESTRTRAAGRI